MNSALEQLSFENFHGTLLKKTHEEYLLDAYNFD
jgi:hypothetical protein